MKEIVFSGHQPNFLPYMGVFYKMYRSDMFVLDDDVQYSSEGLHNANFLKVNNAKYRMTVPVRYSYGDSINQVRISYESDWIGKLLKTIRMSYGKMPHFKEAYPMIEAHLTRKPMLLVDLNIPLLEEIKDRFGLSTKLIVASKDVYTPLRNNDRNICQCKQIGGTVYYSGIGGKAYNDEDKYRRNGIEIVYSDYQPTRYRQNGRPFIENLSVLDYVFCKGFEIPDEWR